MSLWSSTIALISRISESAFAAALRLSRNSFALTFRLVSSSSFAFLAGTSQWSSKGVCIKNVGGEGGGGFYKFSKKHFVAQGTVELNISWPSYLFKKYLIAPPINFCLAFKPWLSQYFKVGSIHRNIKSTKKR